MRKRKWISILGGAAMIASSAFASSPVLKGSASVNTAGAYGKLGVLMSESGLAPGEVVQYQLSADVTATYTNCTENWPDEVGTWQLMAGSKGTIRKDLTLTYPPSMCGGTLQNVVYSNITLTDETDNITLNLGTASLKKK